MEESGRLKIRSLTTTTIKTTNANNISTIALMAAISKDVRRMLGLSLHGWENAMVVLLIVAGFTAFGAGVATWIVVRLQRIEIAKSEQEFAKYKLETAKEISEANERTEKQRAKNLEIQRALQERRIVMGSRDGDGDVRAARFAEVASQPMTAYLAAVPDFEASILENDIEFALRKSGWTVVRRPDAVNPAMILPGVHIVTFQGAIGVDATKPEFVLPPPTDATRAAFSVFKLLFLDLGPPNGPALGVMMNPEYRGAESFLKRSPITLDDRSILICIGSKPVPSPDAPAGPPLEFK